MGGCFSWKLLESDLLEILPENFWNFISSVTLSHFYSDFVEFESDFQNPEFNICLFYKTGN